MKEFLQKTQKLIKKFKELKKFFFLDFFWKNIFEKIFFQKNKILRGKKNFFVRRDLGEKIIFTKSQGQRVHINYFIGIFKSGTKNREQKSGTEIGDRNRGQKKFWPALKIPYVIHTHTHMCPRALF